MRNCWDIHDKGDGDGDCYGGSFNDGCRGVIYNRDYFCGVRGIEQRVCLLRIC